MAFLQNWWEALTAIQQAFAFCAIPASVLLVIQTVLLLIGMGGDDADADCELDHDHSLDDGDWGGDGMQVLTVRGIVAFFAVGGWLGIAMIDLNIHPAFSSLIALAGGCGIMFVLAWIMKGAKKMQSEGNISYENAVGQNAEVYMTIPAGMSGKGKVNLVLQNRYVEVEAISSNHEPLTRGMTVRVVELSDNTTLIVEPLNQLVHN